MLQLFPKSYRANQRVFIIPLIVDLLEELIICLTYFPRSATIPGQLDFFQCPIPLKESILPFPHSTPNGESNCFLSKKRHVHSRAISAKGIIHSGTVPGRST